MAIASFEQEFAASHPGQDATAAANPMLMGLSPAQYVLGALEKVRPAEMEQALLLLPFSYALDLLGYLCHWLEKGLKVCLHLLKISVQRSRCKEGYEMQMNFLSSSMEPFDVCLCILIPYHHDY